jgi:hypothetical protein
MDHSDVLSQAASIVAKARQAHVEATVAEFEHSDVPSLQSLARVYRMLQWPPQQ